MHKCHRLIQMKEEVFFDERHCAQECLQAIMLVHTKLNVIQRTIRIDKKKWPTEEEADLKPLEDLLEAAGDLDLRNEVLQRGDSRKTISSLKKSPTAPVAE